MRALSIPLRVLLAVAGGYAASAALSAALAVSLQRIAGLDRAESTVLCAMLGFAFYLLALLWAFTTPRLGRVALVLVGSSAFGYGVVHLLAGAPAAPAAAPAALRESGGKIV